MISQHIALLVGAAFGMFAVIFGAFGAHALKKVLNSKQLKGFETGIKYQMYHALALLFTGSYFSNTSLHQWMYTSFIAGTVLFSFSIYGLVISDAKGKKFRFLGPITPLGGLLLIVGWGLLFYNLITTF